MTIEGLASPNLSRTLPDRFRVAFSFAGEHRGLVREIALAVEAQLGRGTVFLDEWFQHYLAGVGADLKLQEIYGEQSELVVICISQPYGVKPWTQIEHEIIRSRQAQACVSKNKRDREAILPIRVGEGELPGISFTTIAPDVRQWAPKKSAELIIDRLRLIVADLPPRSDDSPTADESEHEYTIEHAGEPLVKILDHKKQIADIQRFLGDKTQTRHIALLDAIPEDWPAYLADHVLLDPWPNDPAGAPSHEPLDINPDREDGFWDALVKVTPRGSDVADLDGQRVRVRDWVNAKSRLVLYAPLAMEQHGWHLPRMLRSAWTALDQLGRWCINR